MRPWNRKNVDSGVCRMKAVELITSIEKKRRYPICIISAMHQSCRWDSVWYACWVSSLTTLSPVLNLSQKSCCPLLQRLPKKEKKMIVAAVTNNTMVSAERDGGGVIVSKASRWLVCLSNYIITRIQSARYQCVTRSRCVSFHLASHPWKHFSRLTCICNLTILLRGKNLSNEEFDNEAMVYRDIQRQQSHLE
jgi:hypothetical protein